MKAKMSLFLIAIAATGLFAFPNVLATFAGSHTMEKPLTDSKGLDCTKCHEYIQTELNPTTLASGALAAHKEGAGNVGFLDYMAFGEPGSYNSTSLNLTNGTVAHTGTTFIAKGTSQGGSHTLYTDVLYVIDQTDKLAYHITANWNDVAYNDVNGNPMFNRTSVTINPTDSWVAEESQSLDANGNSQIEDREVCKLCHTAGFFGVEGTHTDLTVVGCTNTNCHGNKNNVGKVQEYFGTPDDGNMNAGYRIARTQDAHSNFYIAMNSTGSAYANVTADYYTCLACHTHVGMKLTIKRPAAYDVSLNKSGATMADYKNNNGAWFESLEINHTATNFGTNGTGTFVNNASLNSSNVTIIKDPTSVWIPESNSNTWNK
ncbi:Uncharacterised protein [uncultured archaeon]|nr:Uncharacterised protein [uncultured archaeon]